MPAMMIRYQVAEDGVGDVIDAVKKAFAAIAREKPTGTRYTYFRRAGSTELIAILELEAGVDNPLPGIAEARALQATVAKWAVGDPPTPQPLETVGDYASAR